MVASPPIEPLSPFALLYIEYKSEFELFFIPPIEPATLVLVVPAVVASESKLPFVPPIFPLRLESEPPTFVPISANDFAVLVAEVCAVLLRSDENFAVSLKSVCATSNTPPIPYTTVDAVSPTSLKSSFMLSVLSSISSSVSLAIFGMSTIGILLSKSIASLIMSMIAFFAFLNTFLTGARSVTLANVLPMVLKNAITGAK